MDLNILLARVKPVGSPVGLWDLYWTPEGHIFQVMQDGPTLVVHNYIVNFLTIEMEKKNNAGRGKSDNAAGHNKDEKGKPINQNKPTPKPKPGKPVPEVTKPANPTVPAEPTEPAPVQPAPIEPPKIEEPKIEEPKIEPPKAEEPQAPTPVEETPSLPIEEPKAQEPTTPPILEAPAEEVPGPIINVPPLSEEIPDVFKPTKPASEPVIDVPVTEVKKPKPTQADPIGTIVKGSLKHLARVFTDDGGSQDSTWMHDGKTYDNGWITGDGNKVRNAESVHIVAFKPENRVKMESITLSDGYGKSGAPVRFNAILNDGKYTVVKDIIPEFYGPDNLVTKTYDLIPAAKGKELRGLEVVYPTSGGRPTSVIPTEFDYFGSYVKVDKKPYPIKKVSFDQINGVVDYVYNLALVSSRGIDKLKAEPLKFSIKKIRLYLDMPGMLTNTGFGFNPMPGGGWLLDQVLEYWHSLGKEVYLCPKGDIGDPRYVELCRQLALRYGPNADWPDEWAKIDTKMMNPWQGEAGRNHILKGVNWIKGIQCGNENGAADWKPTADEVAQTNLGGFYKPSAMLRLQALCYNAIKEVCPGLLVITNGLPLVNPGYVEAMIWEAKKQGIRFPADVVASHYYCKLKGAQRQGVGEAMPPEMINFFAHQEAFLQMLYDEYGENAPDYWHTEEGYSVSEENVEQAVNPIGKFDRYQVAGIFWARTRFCGMIVGLGAQFAYQAYEDKQYLDQLAKPKEQRNRVNWDLSCFIASRFGGPHVRIAASDYLGQLMHDLEGYYITERPNKSASVWLIKLEKEGAPVKYVFWRPDNTDKVEDFVFDKGAKSITVSRPQVGSDNMTKTIYSLSGSKTLQADIMPTVITVNS